MQRDYISKKIALTTQKTPLCDIHHTVCLKHNLIQRLSFQSVSLHWHFGSQRLHSHGKPHFMGQRASSTLCQLGLGSDDTRRSWL